MAHTSQWISRRKPRGPRFALLQTEPLILTTWPWRQQPRDTSAIAMCKATPRVESGFGAKRRKVRLPREIARELTAAIRPSNGVSCPVCWWRAAPIGMPCRVSTTQCRDSPIGFSSLAGLAEGAAVARILACWMDDEQKVLRVDAGAEIRGSDWPKITLTPDTPPPRRSHGPPGSAGAGWTGVVRRIRSAPSALASARPRALVNQVGYELSGTKTAVVATNFFPTDGSTLNAQIVDAGGSVALATEVPCSGRIYSGAQDDWGWYFWPSIFRS